MHIAMVDCDLDLWERKLSRMGLVYIVVRGFNVECLLYGGTEAIVLREGLRAPRPNKSIWVESGSFRFVGGRRFRRSLWRSFVCSFWWHYFESCVESTRGPSFIIGLRYLQYAVTLAQNVQSDIQILQNRLLPRIGHSKYIQCHSEKLLPRRESEQPFCRLQIHASDG